MCCDRFSRRDALGVLAAAGGALLLRPAAALGQAKPATDRVDPSDPAARALGYVETAAAVDRKRFPTFIEGSSCENCLQLEGSPGPSYRPCKIFNGKKVAVAGWCSAWTAEM